jgi:hypothetical protein
MVFLAILCSSPVVAYGYRVRVYALVSQQEAAEAFIEEVRRDEPDLEEMLGVEAIELVGRDCELAQSRYEHVAFIGRLVG